MAGETFRLDDAAGTLVHYWGRGMHLVASAPRTAYNDLGEGIHQTLLGDATVDGLGSCVGRAGLEVRGDIIPTGPWPRA